MLLESIKHTWVLFFPLTRVFSSNSSDLVLCLLWKLGPDLGGSSSDKTAAGSLSLKINDYLGKVVEPTQCKKICARQIGFIFPKLEVNTYKYIYIYIWNHHLVIFQNGTPVFQAAWSCYWNDHPSQGPHFFWSTKTVSPQSNRSNPHLPSQNHAMLWSGQELLYLSGGEVEVGGIL